MDILKALFFHFACAKDLHGIHCECYQCLRLVRGWVSAISFQLSILQGVREKKSDLDSFIWFWTGNIPLFSLKYFYTNCMARQWQTPVWEDMESPIWNPRDTSTDSVAFGSHERCTVVFHLGCHHWSLSDKKLGFYLASKKKSAVSSVVLRVWGNTEVVQGTNKAFMEPQRKKGP